jgi:hypothetical protein
MTVLPSPGFGSRAASPFAPELAPKGAPPLVSRAVRFACLALLTLSAGLTLGACGDGDPSGLLQSDAQPATTPDEPDEDASNTEEEGEAPKPPPVELPPDELPEAGDEDAATPDASEADAAAASDASEPDAAQGDDAALLDAGDGLDANTDFDASVPEDAGLDGATLNDTGTTDTGSSDGSDCPNGAARDACGVCGGSATTCHPLFGRYAARTQLYARQRSELAETPPTVLDLVSKGVLLSLVDIDAEGRALEHFCLLELGGSTIIEEQTVEIASWVKPSASQRIPDTTLSLQLTNGRYTRALAAHKAYYGYLPDACSTSSTLPAGPTDCRVRDTDQDNVSGGAMFLNLEKPADPEAADSLVELRVAALLSFGWSLPATASDKLVGTISGGFQLSELSRAEGPLSEAIGPVLNAPCPDNLGHIELVRSASATCASIVAGRVADPVDANLFDVALDGPVPALSACTNPVCSLDGDSDGTGDCTDGCPADPAKIAAGACGCGNAETNSDNDAAPNCIDGCPQDPAKVAAGACGCGTADTNTDGDSLPDCTDACDGDPNKTVAGACGCGALETNADGDAQPDCTDQCDNDRNKVAPGVCGCGNPETNRDGDTLPDCTDACDDDANKTVAGACGCGTPETNTDGDAQPDCTDQCDSDANKVVPGQCGCGVRDVDLNGDGSIDCSDACPSDPAKVAPGLCGCGVADTNSDGDSRPNCTEDCDSDPNKLIPGQCGCGIPDTDADADGVANCNDACPNDPTKTGSSLCGCGVPDTDSDGDGRPNCTDTCPNDRNKFAPGLCGCGTADTNADGDSQPACRDTCDSDATKLAPGACGCGVADTNTDGDALPDCTDQCDDNAALTVPGACGCTACPTTNPLIGTFAVRSALFGRQRNGAEVLTSKSLNYALVTVSQNGDGSLRLSERGCWTQSVPNPEETGTKAYSWSKPAWVQALPLSAQNLVANSNGSYTRTIPSTRFGWDPARQPATCSTAATPLAPWPSGWGATCTCNSPASALPPYDRNAAPYDCRLIDADGDGQPGMSAVASTSAPSSPDANPPLIGGTAFAAVTSSAAWQITPQSNGRHTATINDTSTAQLVGCTGLACAGLSATPAGNVSCPQNLNRAQFVPVSAESDTCAEIITTRNTLFAQDQDPTWASVVAACPAPPAQ